MDHNNGCNTKQKLFFFLFYMMQCEWLYYYLGITRFDGGNSFSLDRIIAYYLYKICSYLVAGILRDDGFRPKHLKLDCLWSWFYITVISHERHDGSHQRQIDRLLNSFLKACTKNQRFMLLALCEGKHLRQTNNTSKVSTFWRHQGE